MASVTEAAIDGVRTPRHRAPRRREIATPSSASSVSTLNGHAIDNRLARKAAHAARRQFQEKIVRSQRQFLSIAVSRDVVAQRLMSNVVENAQLAALEIAEGTEISEVPAQLDAVSVSVSRTVEVLGQLIRSGHDPRRAGGGR